MRTIQWLLIIIPSILSMSPALAIICYSCSVIDEITGADQCLHPSKGKVAEEGCRPEIKHCVKTIYFSITTMDGWDSQVLKTWVMERKCEDPAADLIPRDEPPDFCVSPPRTKPGDQFTDPRIGDLEFGSHRKSHIFSCYCQMDRCNAEDGFNITRGREAVAFNSVPLFRSFPLPFFFLILLFSFFLII